MKYSGLYLAVVGVLILLGSCRKFLFREIQCRELDFGREEYWNPESVGDSITFVNASSDRKNFTVREKYILHTTGYTSDTGCGCTSVSYMLMTDGMDSIGYLKSLKYVESQVGNTYEFVQFALGDKHKVSSFIQQDASLLKTYEIGNVTVNDVKKYVSSSSESTQVKSAYLSKNKGLIRFEMSDGEIWNKEILTDTMKTTLESFDYRTDKCE